ncbi:MULTISPECIES: hypothetical protein [unclassified Aurantimonas]|uniref:hypothetical protein n=1 Tax=unclassified Aurantimonas TaxID=2638230 RepID=UPI002E19E0BF|nr:MULTISPECIES: hypothetical protein [unclassified Aurantimonas]MEC5293454.1 hypothetical protein [Aurantimonas sp. C2-3-R2]MEC5414398.1 hypothetical protein [Aurantimonas sp. C2-4-R8]
MGVEDLLDLRREVGKETIQQILEPSTVLAVVGVRQASQTVLGLREVVHHRRLSHPHFTVADDAEGGFGGRVMNEALPGFTNQHLPAEGVREENLEGSKLLDSEIHI